MFKHPTTTFIIALFMLSFHCQVHARLVIQHDAIASEKDRIAFEVLQLAISRVEPNAVFKQVNSKVPPGRLETELLEGGLSVIWGSASQSRDKKYKTIRLPVLKGILGHRIFIIHKDNQYKFDNLQTFDDLKKLTGGLGRTWGDTQIMKNAGLPVVTSKSTDSLLRMVNGQRFDYFPRGLHEPWDEIKRINGLDLVVEKNILLIYPQAMHFYVAPNNQSLHDLIYKGLEMALNNGEHDKLFYNDPMIKQALIQADIKNRTVIKMDNKQLHIETPLTNKEYWISVL